MERQYAVKTRYTFTGTFFINARNKGEARECVEKHCGLVLGKGISSTLPDDAVDWDFPVHPDVAIVRICPSKNRGMSISRLIKKYRLEEFQKQGGNNETSFN